MAFRAEASGASPVADWLKVRLRRLTAPSWILSGLLHLGLAAMLVSISQWQSCRGDFGGDEGESFHAVGLRTRPAAETQDDSQSTPRPDQTPADQKMAEESVSTPPASFTASDQPPVPLQLPTTSAASMPVLGLGPAPVPSGAPAIDNLIRPLTESSGSSPPAISGGAISGGTSFLGIKDVGRRFVYVIDRSSSMDEHGALYAAKRELLSSLERLDEKQEFQVIFYSNEPYILQTRDRAFNMFRGTDILRLQARNQIAEVTADGGTQHFPALVAALKFNPDVIFLLTDGANDTALSFGELNDLKKMNRGGARIHCVEFGTSQRALLTGNFLSRLAEQNNGQHIYRDVTQLRSTVK